MKGDAAAVRALARRPRPDIRLYLIFGADDGGNAALAAELASGFGPDVERIDFDGPQLSKDPSLLAAEAASLSLFGDKRYIRVTTNGEECLPATETLLAAAQAINPVIMLASGISEKSRIAKLALASPLAMAVQSKIPTAADMSKIVIALGHEAGLTIEHDLAEVIAGFTAADRRLAAQEVEKLALYLDASPDAPKSVTREAITALRADAGDDAMQPIINAALSGNLKRLPEELQRMREQAVSEVGLVIVMQRQVMQLAAVAARMGTVRDVGAWVSREKSGNRLWGGGSQSDWTRQLTAWGRPATMARLVERLLGLQQAMMQPTPGPALLLEQELLEIAKVAARAS
ncbi:DNA polymerase III subunit delta [Blastomonas sp.]|uniref:DNA polymerase III subunit delta n=1 Tax=Blastomonas sp. TaxID=1909299 RepID=UPI003593DF9A